jgi:hypothetical protein
VWEGELFELCERWEYDRDDEAGEVGVWSKGDIESLQGYWRKLL